LGTLILLLALVAQNATDSAEERARAQTASDQAKVAQANKAQTRPSKKEAEEVLSEASFRVEQLVAFRDQQTADLEQRRDQLTHVEDHMQRLKDRLVQLQKEAEMAMGIQPVEEIDEKEIDSLKTRLADELADLEEMRKEAANKKPRVVIVPHKGPNGTNRRPVYLECNENGLRIWPEGSSISFEQLINSARGANPLDAALRTVRLHAMKHYGDTEPPYPLLVVRPGGEKSYLAARYAMADWDDHFGYELVPAEVELAFDQPDSGLRERIDVAIRETSARQRSQVVAGIGSTRSGGNRTRFGSGRTRAMPTLSAAALDREGRTSGYQAHREQYPQSQSHGSPYVSSSRTHGSSTNYPGTSYSATSGGGRGNQVDQQAAAAAAADRRLTNDMQDAARELRAKDPNHELAVPELAVPGVAAPGFNGGTLNGTGSTNAGLSGNTPSQIQDDHHIQSLINASTTMALRGELGAENGIGSQGSGFKSLATGSKSKVADDPTGGESVEVGAEQPTSSSISQIAGNGEIERSYNVDSSDAAVQLSQSGSQVDGGGGEKAAGAKTSSNAAMATQDAPSQMIPQDGEQQVVSPNLTHELSHKRSIPDSRNWALPSPDMQIQGNTVVRSVRMQCYQNRFVLSRSSTSQASTTFQVTDQNLQQAVLDLGLTVRDRIARWGAALPGGRWEPQLEVEVFEGAEQRFAQLVELMSDSGLNIVLRPAK
jgi:hypothetical protein